MKRNTPLALLVLALLAAGLAAGAAAPGEPPPAPLPAPPSLSAAHVDAATGRLVAPLGEGRAVLTIDPALQAKLVRSLETYRVPWGATVLLEPATGRVLALAAFAPAASLFKIVTAAALLEEGVNARDEVCYHGGRRRLAPRLLADDPRRDRRCLSLTEAFGHSTNVVFAKLADRDLDPDALRAAAERFLFNVPIAFAEPVEPSPAEIPDDPFALAKTAAGFGDVRISPLHAALVAAVVANGGTFVPPVIVDEAEGSPFPPPPPEPWRVVDEGVAGGLAAMMRATVESGTARRVFRRPGRALQGVEVAGKTGSIAEAGPYRDTSWFVGYAPADRPVVAVATVVVNDRLWHARAPTVAREALEAYFAGRRDRTAAAR